MPAPPSLGRLARSSLREARQAYIAIDTPTGPHVTPELYAFSGGRVWFASARTTLKARRIADGDRVAVAVPVRGRTVVVAGPVARLDPASPRDVLRLGLDGPAAASGLAAYALRNAEDLLAFGRDWSTGRLGLGLPPRRVAFSVAPEDGSLVVGGTVLPLHTEQEPASEAAGRGLPAVAAFAGPTVASARWDGDRSELTVAPGCAPGGGDDLEVAVVLDEYVAPGPAAKVGVMLRGTAREVEPGRLRVDVARVVTWEGVETTSTALGAQARAEGAAASTRSTKRRVDSSRS